MCFDNFDLLFIIIRAVAGKCQNRNRRSLIKTLYIFFFFCVLLIEYYNTLHYVELGLAKLIAVLWSRTKAPTRVLQLRCVDTTGISRHQTSGLASGPPA
jgi:hypothetical protein